MRTAQEMADWNRDRVRTTQRWYPVPKAVLAKMSETGVTSGIADA
jgi:hypothetical protein